MNKERSLRGIKEMSDFEVSGDARVVYSGSGEVKSYGSSSNSEPFIGLHKLDKNQFDFIMSDVPSNTPVMCILGIGKEIVWNCEMQLKAAYDSTAGRWIKLCFVYNQESVDLARSLKGKSVYIDIIEGQVAKKPKLPKGEHGQYASQLIQSKVMTCRNFWKAVGPEERYLDWVRSQPCMITGGGVENEAGDMRCEAAHVRDIKYGAGIATKPEYFAIPLHPDIHSEQHDKGVFQMWKRAGRPTPSAVQYPIVSQEEHIRQWLQISTLEYIKKWIQVELKSYFNVHSMSYISEQKFEQFVSEKALPEEVVPIMELSKQKRDLGFLARRK